MDKYIYRVEFEFSGGIGGNYSVYVSADTTEKAMEKFYVYMRETEEKAKVVHEEDGYYWASGGYSTEQLSNIEISCIGSYVG